MNQPIKTNRKGASDEVAAFRFQAGIPYADKNEYAAKGLVFEIRSIYYEANAGFEGQDRWLICVHADKDRGEELITLQCNDKRDAQMRSANAFIEVHGAIKGSRLKKSGRTFYFENNPIK